MTISVFLADDHTVVRDGLRLLLESQDDITVVGEAADGRQAVRQVQKLKPDVVIMDIAMPELNGIEATQNICKTCPSSRVLILSMHASKEYIFRALKAGATGYLLKESAGREVIIAVRALHLNRRYLHESVTGIVINDYLEYRQADDVQSRLDLLSSREREILQLVVEGKTSAEIADTISLSPKTVETYRSRLMQKLAIKDIPGLVRFAIKHGIVTIE